MRKVVRMMDRAHALTLAFDRAVDEHAQAAQAVDNGIVPVDGEWMPWAEFQSYVARRDQLEDVMLRLDRRARRLYGRSLI
jgi:hypothetical protein